MTKKEEAKLKRAQKLEAEKQRIESMKIYERRHRNCAYICGIDEAGRGPFAGPVVAGAVVLSLDDPEKEILYLNDSKKLTEKKREALYPEILSKAVAVGIGTAGARIIDEINILQATYYAMQKAILNLTDCKKIAAEGKDIHEIVKDFVKYQTEKEFEQERKKGGLVPDFILADAVKIPEIIIPQEGIVKGDAKSVSIAAASVVAKVTRDHIMLEYDKLYPQYGFASHKGYGTPVHIAAIKEYGMLDIHRRSFIHF